MAGPPDTPDAGAFHSVSGHWILGSTGHWPVPSGDSPDGMGRTPPTNDEDLLRGAALLIPVGGSPTGTGGSPVLPFFKHALRAWPEIAWVAQATGLCRPA